MIIPLPYSIPSNLVSSLSEKKEKTFLIAPLIPAKGDTYIYKSKKDYLDMYKKSLFAFTFKKGGWDCLRHYEIVACGCVPIFIDLHKCPKRTLDSFPKATVKNAFKAITTRSLTAKDYNRYRTGLLHYTKNELTCEAIAEKLLKRLSRINNNEQVGSVLVYNRGGCNYSREMLTIGLRNILGKQCVDFPRNELLYKNTKKPRLMITLEENINEEEVNRENIERKIKTKEFTYIIITGCEHVGYNFWQDRLWKHINGVYDSKHVLFLFGGDMPTIVNNPKCILNNNVKNHEKHGICLVRELDDNSGTAASPNYDDHYQSKVRDAINRDMKRCLELAPLIAEKQKHLVNLVNLGNK